MYVSHICTWLWYTRNSGNTDIEIVKMCKQYEGRLDCLVLKQKWFKPVLSL